MAIQRLTLALDAALVLDFETWCQVRGVRPETVIECLLAQCLAEWTAAEMQAQAQDLEDAMRLAREGD